MPTFMKAFPALLLVFGFLFLSSLLGCRTRAVEDVEETAYYTPTLFYMIRHAEKEAEGENPGLNAKGQARAELIKTMLANTPLDAIYSTPFLRNRATVEPLASLKNLEITIYDPNDTPALLKSIFEKHPGGTILIVGHSNTVPGMVNTLIGEDKFENLSETEYQRLFIVAAAEYQKGTYSELNFEPSVKQ
jgi:phosphohistidine phosphatase SixA